MINTFFRTAALLALAFFPSVASAYDMLTFHNDNQRTGANTSETILKQSNVNQNTFGKLYGRNVDGIMYAQPLYVSNVSIGGGTHNVVYVATMHDSVYAFDADIPSQPAYWQKSMGTAVPYLEVYTNSDPNMSPEIGVCSTPVIDKSTNTMYLVAMTKEATNSYAHRLHALDLTTGNEKFGGPVQITLPSQAPSSAVFNSFRQGQRPALLMANGSIYFGFASFGDLTPYWGYMMRHNPTTLARQSFLNVNPGSNSLGAGIWQSGCGPAVDASGNVYFITGNASNRDAKTGGVNYSECAIKLSSTGTTVADYFMPSDVDNIDGADADFGGGGHMLLPDQPGTKPHVMVCAGKNAKLYVIDRDNMTHYANDNDVRIMQKISLNGGQVKGTPVYWVGPSGPRIFEQGENSTQMVAYSIAVGANGYIQLTQAATSNISYRAHHWVVSSNGSTASTGVLWTWSANTNGDIIHQTTPIPSTFRAFNAETLVEIYNSGQATGGRDTYGGFAKYTSATVANGRAYVPSSGGGNVAGVPMSSVLQVYGLLTDNTPPTISTVTALNVPTTVTVVFSENVDAASAATAGNYGINQGVAVSNASLGADQRTVTLTTSTLSTGITYTLTVNGVKDAAQPGNFILPNTQKTFSFTTAPPTVSITSPGSGNTFTAPAVFSIAAIAGAGTGASISKVDFFLNGNLAGTATSAPYMVTVVNVAAGPVSITAKATDNTTLSATSAPVNVTVNAGSGTYGLNTRPPIGAYLNGQLPSLSTGSFPATLSGVTAFSQLSNLTPAAGLMPYTVNSPLWSDNAQKMRWLAIPNDGDAYTPDEQIGFASTGEWTFPNGSVFVKHFDLGVDDTNPNVKKRLETRFLVRDSSGGVYGVTYKWRADNSDADLVSSNGLDEAVSISTAGGGTRSQTWHYPSRAECIQCHTAVSGGVLGVKSRQLNGNFTYPSTSATDNQLRTFNHLGLFNPVIQESDIATYSKIVTVSDATASLETRVRSYIDANCSFCHRPGGNNAAIDARFDTPLANQNLIYGPLQNNLGVTGAKVVVPKDLAHSMLYLRPSASDATKMPPIAHNLVDSSAVSAISAWINSLPLINDGANTLSVQFKDTLNGGNNTVTGMAGVAARTNWNTLLGSTGLNQTLKDNTGLGTSALVSWSAATTGSNSGPNTGGDDSLLKGYLESGATNVLTATVDNIPFSVYNVYVYGLGNGSEGVGQYWAKSTASPGGNDPGGKVIHHNGTSSQALQDATTTGAGNYVVFTGLTNPTCVISAQALQYPGSGNGARGPLSGFQIMDATQSTPTLNGTIANAGPAAGGQRITVRGANLLPGATFTIGGAAALSPQYLSDKAYAMTTPPGLGAAAIVYTGANGSVSLSSAYTYGSVGTIGDAISYNFNQNDQNGGVQPLGAAEQAGVFARDHWNNSTANVNLAADAALTDNLGLNNGVTVGWSCNNHNTNSEVPDSGGDYRLMRGYIEQTNAQPLLITASDLPAGFQQFDLYVYVSGQHGALQRHADLRINGKTVGANLGTSVSFPYVGAPANGFLRVPDNNADTSQTGNYVLFPNVMAVNSAIRVDVQAPDSDYRFGISGIQMVALAPTLISASPAMDSSFGGATVTLTGTNFRSNIQAITFGGTLATNLAYVDSTHYTVKAPGHAAGVVDIVMTDVNGRMATLPASFTYSSNPPPTLAGVSPNFGPTNGGTAITITGTGFAPAATVQIGGQNGMLLVNVPNLTVVSSTQINLTLPAAVPFNATGLTTIQVTNPDGLFASMSSAFRYTKPFPILQSIDPTSGPSSGSIASNAVTLTASNQTFTASGVQVVIGGVTVPAVTVDDQHVTFVPPAHTQGVVSVSAINGDGPASVNTLANSYTYAPPTITALLPFQGPTAGGNTVLISGTNFGSSTTVKFGANAVTGITIIDATTLSCIVPASPNAAIGSVDVTISDAQTPPGSVTFTNGYAYVARQPEFANANGKIPGVCAKFYYGGSANGVIASTGPTTFDSRLPYQGKVVASNAMSPGTILNLIPANAQQVNAKISGYLKIDTAGLYTLYTSSDDGSLFYFGNNAANTSLVVDNNLSQTLTEKSGQIQLAAGLHQFAILYAQGTGPSGFSASISGPDTGNAKVVIPNVALFTDVAPVISTANPNAGSIGGNTVVTLNGTGFVAGSNVTVDGAQASGINVASATSLTFTTPAGNAGLVNIVVVNPNGSADSVVFTYDPTYFRTPDNPANTTAGAFFRYYNLGGPTLPTFTGQTPFRAGAKPNASVLPESTVAYPITQNDNHSQQISGYINIPYAGMWTFYAASDDATLFYIGSTLVVNNNFAQTLHTRAGSIGLSPGMHKFTLQFAQGSNSFGAYLGWGCNNAPGTIPLDALGTDHDGPPSVANRVPDSAFAYVPPTWKTSGITGKWSAAANWATDVGLGAFSPVQADTTADSHESLVLRFPAVGVAPYIANNDSAGATPIYVLELNSTVAGNTLSGNTLQFGAGTPLVSYGSLTNAAIMQLGSGAFTISAPVAVAKDLALRGNGTGLVTLSSAISNAAGANLIKADASTFVLTGNGSGFSQADIQVTGGTLGINSTINASTATVGAGAVLRGTGTIAGAVKVAGTLFPGDVSSTLTNAPKGTLTVNSADFSTNGTLRARVWLKDATHAEADNLTIATPAVNALNLNATSKLELRVQTPGGVVVVNNLDVEIVHGGDPTANTYSAGFGNLTLSYGSGVTNMSVLYVNKNFAPNTGDTVNVVATQVANQAPMPALPANSFNRIFLRFNNSVTPVTIESFIARRDGAGALLEWKLISEYRNAGFNVWRRDANEPHGEWTKVNSTLIAGRLTEPDAKTYGLYDWPGNGRFEYRLESIDIQGVRAHYSKLAALNIDSNAEAFAAASSDGVAAAFETASAESLAMRTAYLSQKFAAISKSKTESAQGSALSAKITRIDRNTDSELLASLGVPSASARAAYPDSGGLAQALPRFVSPSSGTSRRGSRVVAKVMYRDSGVLKISQASLPAGFDVRALSIQREGRAMTALAVTGDAMIVYAPGYADDYTGTDAFFLTRSKTPTPVGTPAKAQGLFNVPAANTITATATAEFHDVYFDWALRPYNYPPWFSSQYLTDGSTQRFTLNVPAATADESRLIVNVWSLTGGGAVSPDHNVQAFVNGVSVGGAAWDGGGMALALSFKVPANTLAAGDNTVELMTPAIDGVASQIVLVRSISVQYTKSLRAPSSVEIVANARASQVYEVSGLPTGNLWVVDTRFSDRAQLVAYETQAQADGRHKARFTALAGGTGKYLVVPSGSELAPLSVTKRTIKPIDARAQYLATGPKQFATTLQPLLLAHSKEGLKSSFVDQEEIFDYYGYGRYGPDAIRNAVRTLRPRYLLLVGRTTYDYRNYSGANTDPLCPAFLISTSFWAQATSDALYGDLGRGLPEVSVGRFPVNMPAELQSVVSRTLDYKGISESAWRGHLVADRVDADAGDFALEADSVADNVGAIEWEKNYLGGTLDRDSADIGTALHDAASGGADTIVYIGHGSALHLGKDTPYILDTDSVQTWTGNVVLLQSTCTANWVAKDVSNYQSIAIKALTQPQGGIAASIASTTYCTSAPAVDFMEKLLLQAQSRPARWGDALQRTQQYAFRASAAAQDATAQWYSDLARTECLLGDPALIIFSKSKPSAGSTEIKGRF